jgi:hypothetical protein
MVLPAKQKAPEASAAQGGEEAASLSGAVCFNPGDA